MASRKQWNSNLPNTSKWLPREHVAPTLQNAFFRKCQYIERRIKFRVQEEKAMNIDNFDSGPGVEDIIREELRNLLPHRYSIHAGTIDDSRGRTAGDFEIIVTNDFWFTPIKAGATNQSRNFHYPIEAVYAITEVKQTLNYKRLDEAMEKLVTCHRLYRLPTGHNQVMENLTLFNPGPNIVRNPLSSTIFATNLDPRLSMENIVKRFFQISKTLKREEIIHSICVLDQGTVTWATKAGKGSVSLFMDNLDEPITPIIYRTQEIGSAFYMFAVVLMAHLHNSVLNATDIALLYGLERKSLEAFAFTEEDLL